MPFDPSDLDTGSNLNTDSTFHVQPQAGPVQPQGGTWTATPIDEHFDLDHPLPDFCLQLRDLEQGHPPCVGGEVRASIEAAVRAAFATDFPGAYVDSACAGAGRPEGEALALGVWTRPPDPLSDEQTNAMRAALTRPIGRVANQNIAFFVHARLFRQLAARSWKPRRLDDKGIEQLDGDLHLEAALPDADLIITILETLRVEALSISSTPSFRVNVDTSLNDLIPLGAVVLMVVNPLVFLPLVLLGVYQSWELRHPPRPEESGAGSTIAARLLPPAIPVAGGMKHVIGYSGQLVVTAEGVSVGGVLRPKEPRIPSMALEGPSALTASMGQAILPGHFRAQVNDLRGPLTYAWSSDGEVQVRETDAEVVVRFDAPASGKARFGQVAVTVTDADGLVVSETRKVHLSTPGHQGPGSGSGGPGGGHGQGGGSGSNNPPQEP
jgi:hypothetical protein